MIAHRSQIMCLCELNLPAVIAGELHIVRNCCETRNKWCFTKREFTKIKEIDFWKNTCFFARPKSRIPHAVQHCKVASKRSCINACEKQHLKLTLSTNTGFEDWYPIIFVVFSNDFKAESFSSKLG